MIFRRCLFQCLTPLHLLDQEIRRHGRVVFSPHRHTKQLTQICCPFERMLQKCEQLLVSEAGAQEAVQTVRSLMFVERFAQDIDRRREQLEQ